MRDRIQSLVRAFQQKLGVYRSVMTDQRCPRLARWLLWGALAYALSPIDLIPDFIPVLGHLDDVLVLPVLVWFAARLIPNELIAEHRANRGIITGCPASPCTVREGDVRGAI